MEKIVIIGCGGHAKSVVDIIERQGKYQIIGFVDRQINDNYKYRSYKIIGDDESLAEIYTSGVRCVAMGIGYMGNSSIRNQQYIRLKEMGFSFPIICDPSAIIAGDVYIGEGTVIGKNSVINANVLLDKMTIINTSAIVEHDCNIGEYSHVSVGATLCGNVKVGRNTFIGANSTVIQDINVGSNVIVGAGSLIIGNVNDKEKVMGLVK